MNIQKQVITPGNVEIARGALDATEADLFADELDDLWTILPKFRRYGTENVQYSAVERISCLNGTTLPIISELVEVLEIPNTAYVALNSYQPGGAGSFHTDRGEKTVVVHSVGTGAFDYSPFAKDPKEASRSFLQLTVSPGDIVFSRGKLLHRGSNVGDIPRKNMTFFI